MIFSEPSLFPYRFPTQGCLMVQMDAGAPAFLPAFQEELPTELVYFEDLFLKSLQPFSIKHYPGLSHVVIPKYKGDMKTYRHIVKLNNIKSTWLRKKRGMYHLESSGIVTCQHRLLLGSHSYGAVWFVLSNVRSNGFEDSPPLVE